MRWYGITFVITETLIDSTKNMYLIELDGVCYCLLNDNMNSNEIHEKQSILMWELNSIFGRSLLKNNVIVNNDIHHLNIFLVVLQLFSSTIIELFNTEFHETMCNRCSQLLIFAASTKCKGTTLRTKRLH